MKTIEQEVITIITKELRMKDGVVTSTSKLVEDLGTDSLDAVQILIQLEKRFDIVFAEDDHSKVKTVEDVIGLVKNLL